jgi:RNA polymerase sigma-70 factor (ECF subfamily)
MNFFYRFNEQDMAKDLSSDKTKGITSIEEAVLIKTARSDPTAFKLLYLSYIHPIYRYIFSKVGDASETEDLTSQVFLEALEGLSKYRHDGHFAAWLFTIAHHKVVDHFRSQHSDLPIEVAYRERIGKSDHLSALIQTEEAQRMAKLIHQLDEQDQELLRLRFVAELNYGEIAHLLKSNTETTKKRIYRLLARLRQQLEFDHD